MAADNRVKLQKEAEKLMFLGKTSQAIGEYLKIIRDYPEDVLTLNTVGDLYLSIGKKADANICFKKVADNYVRNNFFLKAIAVYRKILRTDSDNLEVNQAIASLLERQGLSLDACHQYLHLVQLYEKTGNTDKILQAYKKIVDLDPANSSIQKKLAEVFLAGKDDDKGCEHLLHAARSLSKSGDFAAARDCYDRVIQIAPLNLDALKGFMKCCSRTGNASAVLDRLDASVKLDPDNLDIKEMLGEAQLEAGNPETAAEILQTVISADESRYECLIPVMEKLIDLEKCDAASDLLDLLTPMLITNRRTDLAIQYSKQILQHRELHIPTMNKLAALHLTEGNLPDHLEVLDRITDFYIEEKNPVAALEYLEKILQVDPESQKHLDLHKVAFEDAYPDTPYVPPEPPAELHPESRSSEALQKAEGQTEDTPESIVEADLLINYGMKEKALGLLQNLEASDPKDKRVRTRLLKLYKEEGRLTEAAEQSLLLAALYRKSNDEETVEKYLAEAKQLDPDLVERERDLAQFAKKKGIKSLDGSEREGDLGLDAEVDLSDDLLDIFFAEKKDDLPEGLTDMPSAPHELESGYAEGIPRSAPTQSTEEKLQEVDFYIRLGFRDEALNKLNEIAKISPDNPELPQRFEKLKELEASEDPDSERTDRSSPKQSTAAEDTDTEDVQTFEDLDIDSAIDAFCGTSSDSEAGDESADFSSLELQENATGFEIWNSSDNHGKPPLEKSEASPESADFSSISLQDISREFGTSGSDDSKDKNSKEDPAEIAESVVSVDNAMFSDLIEEVRALNEQELQRENFEDHFSLGTAYRDMELIEEAVKEFQTALRIAEYEKDSRKLIQCCGMLSTCFIKKGMPRSALRWCQTGLNVNHITQQEALALRYDMGMSHTLEGNPDLALECFDQIFSTDPGYRDVALKIDEIKSGQKQV